MHVMASLRTTVHSGRPRGFCSSFLTEGPRPRFSCSPVVENDRVVAWGPSLRQLYHESVRAGRDENVVPPADNFLLTDPLSVVLSCLDNLSRDRAKGVRHANPVTAGNGTPVLAPVKSLDRGRLACLPSASADKLRQRTRAVGPIRPAAKKRRSTRRRRSTIASNPRQNAWGHRTGILLAFASIQWRDGQRASERVPLSAKARLPGDTRPHA